MSDLAFEGEGAEGGQENQGCEFHAGMVADAYGLCIPFVEWISLLASCINKLL